MSLGLGKDGGLIEGGLGVAVVFKLGADWGTAF
jgi:hypothetical protein